MTRLTGALLLVCYSCLARTAYGIVGGLNPVASQYRFMVSFQTFPGRTHFCGGAILSEKWIISAAECFQEYDLDNIVSITGCFNLQPALCFEDNYLLAKVVVHPNYSFPYNNLALVKPKEKIDFTTSGEPLKSVKLSKSKAELSGRAFFAGWGRQKPKEAKNDDKSLKHLEANIISNEECNKVLRTTRWTKIDVIDTMFCVLPINPGVGGCVDDQGGPLVRGKEMLGIMCLINRKCVLDNGKECTPMIFTRVSAFTEFIMYTIRTDEDDEKKAQRSSSPPVANHHALWIIYSVVFNKFIVN